MQAHVALYKSSLLCAGLTTRRFSSKLSPLSSNEVRERFLSFFEKEHKHQRLPASSLLPSHDPSLLFTNAGMVQFKDVFMGVAPPPALSSSSSSGPGLALNPRRAVTAQRCMRAGGKHNDLDNVGFTARHHTLFEMLGNFSFADYGPAEAIHAAWHFVTGPNGLAIPRDMLRVSVLQGDEASAALWCKVAGLDDSRIVRCGPADNFWSMGDGPGPCGPCTEIFFDQGREVDGDRWLELWNLVFMQNERDTSGQLKTLSQPSIDTGMGLERVCAVLQGKPTNFDSNVFQPLMDAAFDILKVPGTVAGVSISSQPALSDAQRAAFKVVVDHARASAALIADGVLPAGVGRGYVLRRIIRRALRYATNLGANRPVLCELVPALVASQSALLPGLRAREQVVRSVLEAEETAFLATLRRGERILNDALRAAGAPEAASVTMTNQTPKVQLPASVVFELYDCYGFPLDLTALIARERGASFDHKAVDVLMEERRATSRASWSGSGDSALPSSVKSWRLPTRSLADALPRTHRSPPTADLSSSSSVPSSPSSSSSSSSASSPSSDSTSTDIEAAWSRLPESEQRWSVGARVLAAAEGGYGGGVWVTISPCPFYAQGGGQVGDRGWLQVVAPGSSADGARFAVLDTVKPYDGGVALLVEARPTHSSSSLSPSSSLLDALSCLQSGVSMLGIVDGSLRQSTAAHHSATHLLHSALRQVLGPHVTQAGSLVSSDRLRFDYTHGRALSGAELAAVEDWVNRAALQSVDVNVHQTDYQDAVNRLKAMALFSEKYGDSVRVVKMGDVSTELCGGTHVRNSAEVYPLVIVAESSIGSGARRIEAVAGRAGAQLAMQHARSLRRVAEHLSVPLKDLESRVQKMHDKPGAKKESTSAQITQSLTGTHFGFGFVLHDLDESPLIEAATAAAAANTEAVAREKAERKLAGKLLQAALKESPKAHAQAAIHIARVQSHVALAVTPGSPAHAMQTFQVLIDAFGGNGGGKADQAQGVITKQLPLSDLVAALSK